MLHDPSHKRINSALRCQSSQIWVSIGPLKREIEFVSPWFASVRFSDGGRVDVSAWDKRQYIWDVDALCKGCPACSGILIQPSFEQPVYHRLSISHEDPWFCWNLNDVFMSFRCFWVDMSPHESIVVHFLTGRHTWICTAHLQAHPVKLRPLSRELSHAVHVLRYE